MGYFGAGVAKPRFVYVLCMCVAGGVDGIGVTLICGAVFAGVIGFAVSIFGIESSMFMRVCWGTDQTTFYNGLKLHIYNK